MRRDEGKLLRGRKTDDWEIQRRPVRRGERQGLSGQNRIRQRYHQRFLVLQAKRQANIFLSLEGEVELAIIVGFLCRDRIAISQQRDRDIAYAPCRLQRVEKLAYDHDRLRSRLRLQVQIDRYRP